MQKTFFEVMKQFQGEYMGSLISGVLESMAGYGRPDAGELGTDEAIDQGLSKSVKDFDSASRRSGGLSKQGRSRPMTDAARTRRCPATSSSTSRPGSPARIARSSSPTAAPRSSGRTTRGDALAAGRRRAPRSLSAMTALFTFLSSTKQSVVADPDSDDDLDQVRALLDRATRWCGPGDLASRAARPCPGGIRRDALT